MRLNHLILQILLLSLLPCLQADETGIDSRLAGLFWSPDKDAKIQFYSRGTEICAKIVWLEHPGKDINNPDPARKERNLQGLEIFRGFKPSEGDSWIDGTVYDPDSGSTYRGKMWLTPEHNGRIGLRGYIGFRLFGRTEYLERVESAATAPIK